MMWLLAGLAAGTLISEDAALASAATLAGAGAVPATHAVIAVALGTWLGDVALYVAGRLARRWSRAHDWVQRRCPPSRVAAIAARLNRGAALSIFVSRVIPGTRLPLFVAAGVLALRADIFVVCTALASFLWTAVVVFGVTWLA